jgi:site-specific DNA-methyltransferase (adenine-specific)
VGWEPIAWLFKPYDHTITDNVLEHGLGAINTAGARLDGKSPSNLLRFELGEERVHEAQKPIPLLEFLVKLTTREGQTVLDPFIGSGSTALACRNTNRNFIGFEISEEYVALANRRLERGDQAQG